MARWWLVLQKKGVRGGTFFKRRPIPTSPQPPPPLLSDVAPTHGERLFFGSVVNILFTRACDAHPENEHATIRTDKPIERPCSSCIHESACRSSVPATYTLPRTHREHANISSTDEWTPLPMNLSFDIKATAAAFEAAGFPMDQPPEQSQAECEIDIPFGIVSVQAQTGSPTYAFTGDTAKRLRSATQARECVNKRLVIRLLDVNTPRFRSVFRSIRWRSCVHEDHNDCSRAIFARGGRCPRYSCHDYARNGG